MNTYNVNLISIEYFSKKYYFSEIYRSYLPSFSVIKIYNIFCKNIRTRIATAHNPQFVHGGLLIQ